jgi:hypothetical protein
VILGLDTSLRQSAAVALPLDWTVGDWSAVRSMVVGRSLKKDASEHDKIERLAYLAHELVDFAVKVGATHAFVEDYSYSRANQAHQLGELGGVVRVRLRDAGVSVHVVPLASARKLLLGKVPRSDAKVAVFSALRAVGWSVSTLDEADAFACANYALTEFGGVGLSLATRAA